MNRRGAETQRPLRITLAALVVAFVALALVYSVVTPIFEGPDEIWHYAFADHLANGGGLPVFDPAKPATFLRNGAHPPLYYWSIAALIAPIDRRDFPAEYRFNLANPLVTKGGQSDRPNLFIHTAREDFPYRNATLAAHIARLISVILGAITIIGVWVVARRLLRGNDRLTLIATALAAFVPQFVYGVATINNDALAAAAATWTLYALLRWLDDRSIRWSIVTGILLGITLLSKIGMIALVPLPALAILFASRMRHDSLRRVLVLGALIYFIAFLVAGWWYLRNWSLYGDPLAWREWQALVGAGRAPPTPLDFIRDMIGLFGTFWADFSLRVARVLWPIFGVMAIVALIGLIRRAIKRDWPALDRVGVIIALVWFGLLLASAVRYSFNIYNIHGRLLYPALAAIGVMLALGLSGWLRSKWIVGGVLAIEMSISALSPFVIIQPAYARPIISSMPVDARPVTARFGGVFELTGYRIKNEQVNANEPVDVITYWRRREGLSSVGDLRAVVAIVQPDGGVIGHADIVLGSDAYPTSVWQPDERIVAEISVPTQASAPAVANVSLGMRNESAKLIPSDAGETIGLGRIVVKNDQPCKIDHPADVTFDGSIKLIGYRVVQSKAAGDPARVILCWKSIQPTPIDYTVFVHVPVENGTITADAQPRGGNYPTSAWTAGEQIEDSHPLPAVIDLTIKQVSIGLYRLDTGERLPIDGGHETETVLSP